MGVEHIAWAMKKLRGIGVQAKAVLSALGNHADENGRCWPSLPTIAADSDLSESTVRRVLRQLCNAGALTTEKRFSASGRQQSNTYVINLDWRGPLRPEPATGHENGSEEGCQPDTPSPVNLTPTPVTADTPRGVTADTPTTLNHHSESPGKKEEEAREREIIFQKLVKIFDPGPTESLQRGRLELAALSADEIEQAARHAPAFVSAVAAERRKRPSIAIYLKERRWEAVALNAAKRPSERTGGRVFVRRDSEVWDLWAKYLGKDARTLPTLHSREYGCLGWYFGPTLYPPKQASQNQGDAA
ncbi:helix-turn-helix domain-containing protein [Labrys sp. KB_33_2]|uniref:helix-turn-helix domain-containing protein n=1 Tax=Labrys sp. KB_33_2 TaxID=3237479 RepID=UPI003F90A487